MVDGEQARLVATRCGHCSRLTFPPAAVCPQCWERVDLRRELLPARGVLYAWTVVHIPDSGIAAPYAIGCVDFPDVSVRIVGRLVDWTEISAGDPVEFVAGVLRERAEGSLVGWMIRKAQV